jgi:hypothetical protein
MKTIGLLILIGVLLVAIAKDRASFRMLTIMLSAEQMHQEYINLKSLIPGYATWKLSKIRKEISDGFKSDNNPKRG